MKQDSLNWEEVKNLIDRFYEGTTTREEEELLMELPGRKDVPEELLTDVEVFRALADERQQLDVPPAVPEGLEQRLKAAIEEEEKKEQLRIAPVAKNQTLRISMRRWWMSAAACLLLVVAGSTVWLRFEPSDKETMFASSDITQEEAEAYALYALNMVGSCMKQSVEELECMGKVQEQVRQTLHETITE